MKIRLDGQRCVGHGRCYELAPELFGEDEQGHAVVLQQEIGPAQVKPALRAEANCPEGAIEVAEDR